MSKRLSWTEFFYMEPRLVIWDMTRRPNWQSVQPTSSPDDKIAIAGDIVFGYRTSEHYRTDGFLDTLPFAVPPADLENQFPRSVPLSRIVAASGAFPVALASTPVQFHAKLKQDDSPEFTMRLADGGITDNSGITAMRILEADSRVSNGDALPGWDIDLIIASDATPVLSNLDANKPSFDGSRAIDLVYSRVEPLSPQNMTDQGYYESRSIPPPKVVVLSPLDLLHEFGPIAHADKYYKVSSSPVDLDVSQQDLIYKIESLDDNEVELLFPGCYGACLDKRFKKGRKFWDYDEIADSLGETLSRQLRTFIHTETLKDHFSNAEAEDIFELGRLSVILDAPAIQSELEDVRNKRSHARNRP